jgi:hypothetical protein
LGRGSRRPHPRGCNCLSFDLFDTETLKTKAELDPLVDNSRIASIEAVDIVWQFDGDF